jgi:hypothetical protein
MGVCGWWKYNPEDSSEHHTRRRENLKSHVIIAVYSENYTESINTKYSFKIVKIAGTYNYH